MAGETLPRSDDPNSIINVGYDLNNDGRVDDSERATMQAEFDKATLEAEAKKYAKEADRRVAAADQGAQVSFDMNDDGRVDAAEKAAVEAAKQKLVTQAGDAAESVGGNRATAEAEKATSISMASGAFVWAPSILQYTGGRMTPSTEQQQAMIESYNELNPTAPVSTIEQLNTIALRQPQNPVVNQAIGEGMYGTDPGVVYKWTVTDGQSNRVQVEVDQLQLKAMEQVYGPNFSRKELPRLAAIAARTGLLDSTGNPAWQLMLAAANTLGIRGTGSTLSDLEDNVSSNTPSGTRAPNLSGKNAGRYGDSFQRLTAWAVQYKTAVDQFGGNDALAFLSTVDPALASRFQTQLSAKKPVISDADEKRARQIFRNGRFDPNMLSEMGYEALSLDNFRNSRMAAMDGGSGSGPVRQMPDPAAVEQRAKDLYRSLYAADPSDAQLSSLVSAVNKAIRGADINGDDGEVQDVNVDATLRSQLEALPEYKDLYGKRPGGMVEADYRRQMESGAQSILGSQAADPNNVRSGMRSGQYQTSVGAAAFSREAQDNSTWLGRLAGAAQVINENT